MEPAAFVFSRYRELNGQFMVLFKALDELKQLEPASLAFHEHLESLAGLLRFQFAYEDDLMAGSRYDRTVAHTKAHNQVRCFLGSLLGSPGEDLADRQREFVALLDRHCHEDDNALIDFVNDMHDQTTVLFRAKSEAIRRDGGDAGG